MRKLSVYDLPLRLFHWIFVLLFILSFVIAKTVDDDSVIFVIHMFSGLIIGVLIILRIVWGWIGSTYSRFSHLDLHPKNLVDYLIQIFRKKGRTWEGHNPASSWATLVFLGTGLSLSVTGMLMTSGNKEDYEDLHEILAYTFLITAAIHVSGILIHTLKYRDGIALSMVDGKKYGQSIKSKLGRGFPHSWAALAGLILIILFGIELVHSFDQTTGKLNLMGLSLQLSSPQDKESTQAK